MIFHFSTCEHLWHLVDRVYPKNVCFSWGVGVGEYTWHFCVLCASPVPLNNIFFNLCGMFVGYCTSYPQISMFCTLFFFLKNDMHLSVRYPRNSKNRIKIKVGQAIFESLIKTVFWLFWSIASKMLDLLRFQCNFWVSWTICYKMLIIYIFKNGMKCYYMHRLYYRST